MNKFLILMCLFYSIEAVCVEVNPFQIDVKGSSLNMVERQCGEKISFTYSELINVIDLEITGKRVESQIFHLKRTLQVTELQQQMLNVSNKKDFFSISIVYVNKTLTISGSRNIQSLCIKNISAKVCLEESIHALRKRSSPNQKHDNQQTSSKKEGILFSIILSCGLFLVVITSLVVSTLSCCYKNLKHPTDDAEIGKLTDNSFNSTCSYSNKISLPGMCHLSQSLPHSIPISPAQDIHLKASSPYHSEYISPSGLNIPDIPTLTPTTRGNIELSTDNITDWSADTTLKEQIYHVLEAPQETATEQVPLPPVIHHSSSSQPRERAYFVLEVTSDTPPVATAAADSSEKIYHALDPIYSTNAEKSCSLCSNTLPAEESMYLVILPEQQQTDITTCGGLEPIYHQLEQPSVICQSCLCAEGRDPIYHELERSPDPIYDRVKNLIRQGTSTSDGIYSAVKRQDTGNSDGSHIYSTVHSLDLHEPPITTLGVDSGESHLLSAKRVPLGMTHASGESSDYASIPDDDDECVTDIHKHQHNLTLLVNSLRTKLANRLKMVKQENISTDDGLAVKMKLDTNPSERGFVKEKKKRRPISSPAHSTVVHSLSNTSDQPVIIAQRKKSGSYHILNVEDIWQYQLANRYAPISVVMRRSPSPVKMRKTITSMQTPRSYLMSHDNSNYEVPVPITGGVIPPPLVLKKNLPRQNAIGVNGHSEHTCTAVEESNHPKGKRLYTVKSEPCLETIPIDDDSNDYDILDPLSPIPTPLSSPTKSPLKKSLSTVCTLLQSPSKRRYIERYVPSTHLLYNEDDYDHMWDEEEEEEEGEI